MYNNGKGIPVEIHSKEKIWIPEMIFGHLLSSSNYDDDEKKLTGGRNGYGAKLTNICAYSFLSVRRGWVIDGWRLGRLEEVHGGDGE